MATFRRKLYKNSNAGSYSLTIPGPAVEAIGLRPGSYVLIEDVPEKGYILIRPGGQGE